MGAYGLVLLSIILCETCCCVSITPVVPYVDIGLPFSFTVDGHLGGLRLLRLALPWTSGYLCPHTHAHVFLRAEYLRITFCFTTSYQTAFCPYSFYPHLCFAFLHQPFDVAISSPLADEETRARKGTVSPSRSQSRLSRRASTRTWICVAPSHHEPPMIHLLRGPTHMAPLHQPVP